MSVECRTIIVEEIRREGPVTVARFVELALYHPQYGYYATAARRSGREGDYFTSVDVGPVFGELLAVQFAEMWRLLQARLTASAKATAVKNPSATSDHVDLVEAAAGNGRLAADILDSAALHDPDFYQALDLHLVERSAAARAAQPIALDTHRSKLKSSGPELPNRISGILFANELLDAFPTHVVIMRDSLRELYIDWDGERLVECEDGASTPELQEYLDRANVTLEPGWRVEINLDAARWVRDAARRLAHGFLLLIDYGHDAEQLYAATHSAGTLTTFRRHLAGAPGRHVADRAWLDDPGSVDMTSHVDLTSVRLAAESEGLETIAVLDQTYFLLGLGLADRVGRMNAAVGADLLGPPRRERSLRALKARLALKTLMMPGGLGSVQKVMIFSKGVGRPALRGCSYKVRVT